MQTAAKSYYGKDLKDLSLPQLALLAGMPQAPNQYDPYSHPEAAQQRRNLVLKEMLDMKTISTNNTKQRSIHLLQMVCKVSVLQAVTQPIWIIT